MKALDCVGEKACRRLKCSSMQKRRFGMVALTLKNYFLLRNLFKTTKKIFKKYLALDDKIFYSIPIYREPKYTNKTQNSRLEIN